MELSIESPCQFVTWKVRDFLQLPSEIGYSLDSPEIRFAGDSYCLRLYPNGSRRYTEGAWTQLQLVRLTSTFPERNVSWRAAVRQRKETGDEYDSYLCLGTFSRTYLFKRSSLEKNGYNVLSGGILTALCSIHLTEKSNAGSPQSKEAETADAEEVLGGLPGQSVFSSRWKSSKMELTIESPWKNVTWKVPDFLQLPSEIGYSLDSPEFHFGDDSYCLRLYPNGDMKGNARLIGVKVVRLTTSVPERYASFKVGYKWKSEKGNEYENYLCPYILTEEFGNCILRSDFEKNIDMYVPDGIFSVICSMHLEESSRSGSPQSKETQTSDAEEEQKGVASVDKLQSDYRNLLEKGSQSDSCVVVSGKEFPTHRCVLRARSPVFEAMFSHETAENESGRVVMDDLDPESFGEFLEYLYTGSVEAGLSNDNAFGLYAAADKYDVPTLKLECVTHMRRNLSVDSFCDVMTLALRHSEEDLLQRAIEFFKENLPRIIITVKWQQFLAYNNTSANELLIKALVPGGQRDT